MFVFKFFSILKCDQRVSGSFVSHGTLILTISKVCVLYSEKTFYLLRNYNAYTGPINLVPLLGGKNLDFLFCPPLPYLLLSACADHLILWIQMTSCCTKQLLPGNLHYRLENSCYLNSSLTGTFCTSL